MFTPSIFAVPAAPVICSCAIFGAFFLIASLGPQVCEAPWSLSVATVTVAARCCLLCGTLAYPKARRLVGPRKG